MTTVVLGLDGSCFELIQPWIDDGTLPTFSRLTDEGAAADMQSCLPPVTCPNWQCYATGTNPGKLGVFWWEAVDEDERKIENRSAATDFDGTHYWRFLDGAAAVVNLPTSYPPSEVEGIHVAGGPGAEQTGYTYPESLEEELEEKYDYAVHPKKMSLLSGDDSNNECVPEIYELIDSRFDVLEDELENGEYELVHVTVFYLNVLQHFYWNMDVVKRAWEKIDERVSRLLEMDELDHFFVMSDHGSNEIETTFRINTWLEQHGYLQTESGVSDYLHKAGITQERVRPVLAKLGVEWWARRLLPERVQMLLPDEEGSVDKSAKGDVVDWERSQAVASGQGPVYVLADSPTERKRIVDKLISDLEGLTDEEGNAVFDRVLCGEDVYNGSHADRGPDVVLDQAAGVHIEGKIGNDGVFGEPSKWNGENKDTGMFIGYGPDIDETAVLSDMHILDIAPTVLHLHGEDVPERMDGEVRYDLFDAASEPANRDVSRISSQVGGPDSQTIERDVTDRLEDLGYME
ncbi:alkaline phosphatase family protein [Halorubrum ezzemoulense]|uniref:Alkaline phosphatase family protein n=1 Tax=Halorubrum ezzemoulense TaxID=337243 RepID=A0ABT4Z4D2_HALEZ|nr:alkaline phosphatase family protein [Halorubrum ezzemoulense]MDB2245710.1 alkaline phosphatase family protein [Halorubrum ezzemoulense]MDB2279357.1 alkaline phosphatase family protein [Halorubrum ezzemoulense]MDB2289873.1 alkaline phosphatase family protein [Halorubrum ezzemoulense]MDB2292957.1 alkaline phosphatase family protein [Halorubrum ezzemoulense]MDB2297343.1 alkaline phosphatase family protein [Halorubrum ezzemoulense]